LSLDQPLVSEMTPPILLPVTGASTYTSSFDPISPKGYTQS